MFASTSEGMDTPMFNSEMRGVLQHPADRRPGKLRTGLAVVVGDDIF